jgi:hypothetical protein
MSENKGQNDHLEFLKKLTLPLSNNEKPLKLEGIENDFCCDDCAWLIIRLNKEYQMAFKNQSSSEDRGLLKWSDGKSISQLGVSRTTLKNCRQ